MLKGLGPWLLPNNTCIHPREDIVVGSAVCIYSICQPIVAKDSVLEHLLLNVALTMLLGEMLDIERYGVHGHKLRLLYQDWHTWLTWMMENLHFDRHNIGKTNATGILLHDHVKHLLHVRSRDCLVHMSADDLSVEQCALYISDTWDFCGHSHQFLPENKHTVWDWLGAYRRAVGSPCNQQLYTAGFILYRMCKLSATHSILTAG
jgi:hypothetical protein